MNELLYTEGDVRFAVATAKSEIERLTAERDSLKEGLDGWHTRYLDAEVDAERYRWLRDESCGHPFWKQFDAGMTSNGMDSAIDAAIGEKT